MPSPLAFPLPFLSAAFSPEVTVILRPSMSSCAYESVRVCSCPWNYTYLSVVGVLDMKACLLTRTEDSCDGL